MMENPTSALVICFGVGSTLKRPRPFTHRSRVSISQTSRRTCSTTPRTSSRRTTTFSTTLASRLRERRARTPQDAGGGDVRSRHARTAAHRVAAFRRSTPVSFTSSREVGSSPMGSSRNGSPHTSDRTNSSDGEGVSSESFPEGGTPLRFWARPRPRPCLEGQARLRFSTSPNRNRGEPERRHHLARVQLGNADRTRRDVRRER